MISKEQVEKIKKLQEEGMSLGGKIALMPTVEERGPQVVPSTEFLAAVLNTCKHNADKSDYVMHFSNEKGESFLTHVTSVEILRLCNLIDNWNKKRVARTI